MRRAPSPIEPDVDGSCPLSFGRLVVPVLKSTCKSCHDKQGTGPNFGHSPTSVIDANKKTNSGNKKSGALYLEFKGKVHYFDASGDASGPKWSDRTLACSFVARAPKPEANKKLFDHLQDNLARGNLTEEEFHRMTLWMDCNALEQSC
jgi:hypothetical protein